jgi:hypothetical protein
MRPVPVLLALAGVLGALMPQDAKAQIVPGPRWYRSATGMLGMPPAGVGARDIERMERYLTFGVPYCGGLAASAYAANQAVARNMSTYLATVGATATDPQARVAALRVAAAFSYFPCAYPGKQLPVVPLPPPQPGDPPFSLRSPDLGKVPDAEQETAADLVVRYDTDVARSAATWKNGEQLRLSLVQKGMTLNAQTATAMGRLQPLYEDAATALKAHNWDEALSNLQAAEATTQKIAATVGH